MGIPCTFMTRKMTRKEAPQKSRRWRKQGVYDKGSTEVRKSGCILMLPVIVLSGGLATRMRPYTDSIPKAMIDVAGMPFVHWQLSFLKKEGIKKVTMCVGYLGAMIEEYAGDGSRYGLNISYAYDGDTLLGTGGAIKKIEGILPDAFFVLYGDSYLEIPYKPVEEAFFRSKKRGLMTVYENGDSYDASNAVFWDGQLLAYSKKKKRRDMRHIDYGLGVLAREAFHDFPAETAFDLADVYEKLANDGQLHGHEVFNRFYEIGSPAGLDDLREKLMEGG